MRQITGVYSFFFTKDRYLVYGNKMFKIVIIVSNDSIRC